MPGAFPSSAGDPQHVLGRQAIAAPREHQVAQPPAAPHSSSPSTNSGLPPLRAKTVSRALDRGPRPRSPPAARRFSPRVSRDSSARHPASRANSASSGRSGGCGAARRSGTCRGSAPLAHPFSPEIKQVPGRAVAQCRSSITSTTGPRSPSCSSSVSTCSNTGPAPRPGNIPAGARRVALCRDQVGQQPGEVARRPPSSSITPAAPISRISSRSTAVNGRTAAPRREARDSHRSAPARRRRARARRTRRRAGTPRSRPRRRATLLRRRAAANAASRSASSARRPMRAGLIRRLAMSSSMPSGPASSRPSARARHAASGARRKAACPVWVAGVAVRNGRPAPGARRQPPRPLHLAGQPRPVGDPLHLGDPAATSACGM